MVTREVLWVTE